MLLLRPDATSLQEDQRDDGVKITNEEKKQSEKHKETRNLSRGIRHSQIAANLYVLLE